MPPVKTLYYDLAELPMVIKLAKSTIQRLVRENKFPRPRELSGRRVGWYVKDIETWAESRPDSNLPPPANTGWRNSR